MDKPTINYELFDTVSIPEGVPELGIEAGTRGAVVYVYKPGESVCVEMTDDEGYTIGMVDLAFRPVPRVTGYTDERE